MKNNILSDATKILILVAAVIIVCILCAVGFKMVNNGKAAVTANTNSLTDMSSQYTDIDLSLYDGSLIMGSEVASLVKKAVDGKQYLSIAVVSQDLASTTNYNYICTQTGPSTNKYSLSTGATALTSVPSDRSKVGYINVSGTYLGETLKDGDNNIVCLRFTRQP